MTPLAPRVSIITPTYNHRGFIAQCIDSVRAQRFDDWEQIVVDDGSTDGTPDVVRHLRDQRIRLVTQDHVGLSRLAETYNKALAMSRGDLIAILEGDDYWPEDKLETQVPAFDRPEVILAFGIAEIVSSTPRRFSGRIPSRKLERTLTDDVLSNTPPGRALRGYLDARCLTFTYPCTVLIRRQALQSIGGFLQSAQLPVVDYPTFLRLTFEGSFHYTPRVMGYWRIHSAGTTLNRLESILRGADAEALEFEERHRLRLPFSENEVRRLRRERRATLATYDGRRYLVRRRWSDAVAAFAIAARIGRPIHRIVGWMGLLSAHARLSIECAYRLTGRPWYRLDPRGEVETVV